MITVFFDLETAGLDLRHPVIQLAAVAMEGATEIAAFNARIQFNEADCDPEALRLNSYDAAVWAEHAMPPALVVVSFCAWLRPFQTVTLVSKRTGNAYTVARLAGYNALTFDYPRLKRLFGETFLPCEMRVRDVLQRALFYFDEHPDVAPPPDFKLATVAAYFGIETDGAHDALADARMSAKLAWRLRS